MTPADQDRANAPFHGLRVVDLSDRVSGAFAARLFGDLGAEVILVEPPRGHSLRHEPPFLEDIPGGDRSGLHAHLNRNKLSVAATDNNELGELLDGADLVVTNADPVADAPYATALGSLRPNAVHLSITPHGLASPLAGRRGNELTASARSGWSSINGYMSEPPLRLPGYQAGYVGGVAGFIAAAAAMFASGSSDTPDLVDVSELESLALTVHPWGVSAVYSGAGYCHGPSGRRKRGQPGPLFEAADGRMSLAVGDFRNWAESMQVLQLPGLSSSSELIPDATRHSRDLSAVIAGIARTLPSLNRWSVFHALARLRSVAGVVQDVDDLLRDAQLASRNFLVEATIEGRAIQVPGIFACFHPPFRVPDGPAPRLDDMPTPAAAKVRTRPRCSDQAERAEAPQTGRPLDGVRVLSLAQAWSGTFATEILGLLGADVVQISSLHRNDVWRRVSSGVPKGIRDGGRSQHPLNTQGLYNSVNLNKREVTLDMRHSQGMEIFWRLLPRFDALVDNFRPNVLPSWGVTLSSLRARRGDIIWASISGYGSDGPYSDYPANGSTIEAMAAIASLHGYEGDRGMNTGGLYPDPVAGYFLASAILAALHRRRRSPEVQRIDLSMMEAVATVCGDAVVEYEMTGRIPRPIGNHHPSVAPHNNYPAASGEWIAIAAEDEAAWRALAAHISDPRLHNPEFVTMAGRKANEQALDAIIADWTVGQGAAKAEVELGELGVTAARVVPLYDIYSLPDPHLLASGFISLVDHPEAGPTWLPGRPWKLPTAEPPLTGAPCVGQHSREILQQELGMTDAEYGLLVAAGVTGALGHDIESPPPLARTERST